MRVLVVEDNEDNLALVTFILRSHGHEVLPALSGREGLELVRAHQVDLVLLDIQLPDMDGQIVAQKIRQSAKYDHVPIAAVTSYAMSGDREKLLAAGCDGYIEKPIDPETFMAEIQDAMGARR